MNSPMWGQKNSGRIHACAHDRHPASHSDHFLTIGPDREGNTFHYENCCSPPQKPRKSFSSRSDQTYVTFVASTREKETSLSTECYGPIYNTGRRENPYAGCGSTSACRREGNLDRSSRWRTAISESPKYRRELPPQPIKHNRPYHFIASTCHPSF